MKRGISIHRTVLGFVGALLCLVGQAGANNLAVTNVALSGYDLSAKTAYVGFDISWSNSWRDAENWDAAWVFVKFRAPGSNHWQHALLSANNPDHAAAAGSEIHAAADGAGAFIYRTDAAATGGVRFTRTRLKWNYGASGYTFGVGDLVNVAVQAIEMVYIPAGSFSLGSGGTESGHFYQYSNGSQSTNPYPVTAETAIPVGQTSGNLYYANVGGTVGDGAGPIPDAFPKGYGAFYCMKYELTQGQYADFLNKLTGTQWTNHYYNTTANRYTISGSCTNSRASAPDRGCNWLAWSNGCAYAAWAGLRPMTELEFEKACRGPASPVPLERAWGNTTVSIMSGESGGVGSGTETPTPAGANVTYNNYGSATIQGPVRVGIFATNNATRTTSGAGYYGVMELSGNLYEACISAGTANGRNFAGTHGSGGLDASGNATNADWYAVTAGSVGHRGGNWYWADGTYIYVSDRHIAADQSKARDNGSGWRGVRTAP